MQTDAIRISDFPVSMSDAVPRRTKRVVLAGNPNVGKTTLFNRLTGSRLKVANYPGSTVEQHIGELKLPKGEEVELIDLPGTYSLCAHAPDEQVAVDVLLPWKGRTPDLVVVVVDATALERNLYLASQIIESGIATVIAINMMDQLARVGLDLRLDMLSQLIGAPVVPIVANRDKGFHELLRTIEEHMFTPLAEHKLVFETQHPLERSLNELEEMIAQINPRLSPSGCRARALWALLSIGDDELTSVPNELREKVQTLSAALAQQFGDVDQLIITHRYNHIERILAQATPSPSQRPVIHTSITQRLDRVLTHPLYGSMIFIVVMMCLFEALFSGAEPIMNWIELGVSWTQGLLTQFLPKGPLRDLVTSGIVAGVGNVLVFAPQITVLVGANAILEDVGYLSRVAFLIDRLMKSIGLNGRAFIPLLSGYACAIPAITATRTIENRRDRLITMLALPWASCSARLPVYALIIATVFSGRHKLFGILAPGSLMLALMYLASLVMMLLAATVLRRTVLKGPRPTFLLELPPYRRPSFRNVSTAILQRLKSFFVEAGTVVVALTVILWSVLSFPRSDERIEHYDQLRDDVVHAQLGADEKAARLTQLDLQEKSEQIRFSFGGRVGHWVEPVLEPLGFDWKIGVGILGSFAAREVFISTLAVVHGVADDDTHITSLRDKLRRERKPDGSPRYTPLAGVSLMVFFLLACQCMGTLAVVRRESGSWKWPLFMFSYMTLIAYLASLCIYQGGVWLGIGLS